jgi:hypothetical protein
MLNITFLVEIIGVSEYTNRVGRIFLFLSVFRYMILDGKTIATMQNIIEINKHKTGFLRNRKQIII